MKMWAWMRGAVAVVALVVLCVVSLTGCARPVVNLTPGQKAYLTACGAQPTVFTVPADLAAESWSRAQIFVSNFSNMKIQICTDTILETYEPHGDQTRYGYYVSKMPVRGGYEFTVKCFCNSYQPNQISSNEHILAYYIFTGQVDPDFVNY